METDLQRLKRLLTAAHWKEEDEQWFMTYLDNTDGNDLRRLVKETYEEELASGVRIDPQQSHLLWQHIADRLHWSLPYSAAPVIRLSPVRRRLRYMAAAAVGIIAIVSVWMVTGRKQVTRPPLVQQQRYKNDIPPGGNKAVLTLANGSSIVLDDARNGELAKQGAARILKLDSGRLAYEATANGESNEVAYNLLTTPRGGQFQLQLPDGTRVWLNAASSLRYPTSFKGGQRDVFLTGEAYFEVTHNDKMPFKVHVDGLDIEDLGTHFDVMAYNDEPAVRTTLLEGSVAVSNGRKKSLLRPGEQAVADRSNPERMKVQAADGEEAVAWKNGEFFFHHSSIPEVMRQVARWYDLDVHYQGRLDETFISGNIRKNVNVSEVFRMLEITGEAQFKIEGRNVIAMK